MEYLPQLTFLRQLLSGMHIASCVVEDPRNIPAQIDLQLRADLFGLENYADFLQNSMSQAKDNTIYRFYDEYECSYIFLRLPGAGGYFFIGPYLLKQPEEMRIQQKCSSLELTPEQLLRMRQYYAALPLIEDENLLLTMANTFAVHLWGSPEKYSLEYVDYPIPDRYEPIPYAAKLLKSRDTNLTLAALESHYAQENLLIDAVRKGKLHLLTSMASTVYNNGTEQRLSESLRDRKNYLIILKTLLRKAAEYGGVHPLHLHQLSSHYASQIEHIHSIQESIALQEEMIRSFCQLVKQHSLSHYSYYVGQAITLVQYDLTADLRLKVIAEKLNVNSSYLSNMFHKEVGCTLTAFVNRERIKKAVSLLQMTPKSVQNIAAECGIQDVNYFIKLFKKHTGFTPNRYREQTGSHNI